MGEKRRTSFMDVTIILKQVINWGGPLKKVFSVQAGSVESRQRYQMTQCDTFQK